MKKRKKRVFAPTYCVLCGEEFIPVSNTQKYCDDECRELGQSDYIRQAYATETEEYLFVCPFCGETFAPNRPDQKFCCKDCAKKFLALKKTHSKICEICGKEFNTNRPAQQVCSIECRKKLAKKRWQEAVKKQQEETAVKKKPKKYTAEEWNALTPAERWEQMKLKGISVECVRLGVSYGKLQTMYYNGTLPKDFGIRKTRKAVKK